VKNIFCRVPDLLENRLLNSTAGDPTGLTPKRVHLIRTQNQAVSSSPFTVLKAQGNQGESQRTIGNKGKIGTDAELAGRMGT